MGLKVQSKTKLAKSPVPCIPHKQNLQQPTPGPSGTQWVEDLFRKPSKHNEPPIPGPSQSSKTPLPPHEDAMTHEPEPEVALMQSTEEPSGKYQISFFSVTNIPSPLL
ncbi:hypothetical protein O181_014733 [Austropuccinia psidii MF-1]|uniref:Uncharacterized protein n=1 Tax=Austropuccinia psidii MF-1 TaxID=1389203 RepID=A0A9Q3C1S9_9BASI|nr:hypothetical protein [Austropuccinia psidii MF-1]